MISCVMNKEGLKSFGSIPDKCRGNSCLWRPSFTYKGNLLDISVSANVGYCKEYNFSAKKMTITVGFITLSINV